MNHRLLALVFLLTQFACGRIYNTISNARLECGSDTAYQESYFRFIDGAERPISGDQLQFRSLNGEDSTALTLTSKGCLHANTNGLWIVRHKEKQEGIVLDFKKAGYSSILQLKDLSHENLKPQCPAYEVGNSLNLAEILNASSANDLRGYEINFSVADEKGQKIKNWPWLNFAYLQLIPLVGSFPEGQMSLNVEMRNNFRSGELSSQTCKVKFDYTGPNTFPGFVKETPKSFQNRPFYSISSDLDVRFSTNSDDLNFIDVCALERPDWNMGKPDSVPLPLCENPVRIEPAQAMPLKSRKGFWQLQYRGVDKAGNIAAWSAPNYILMEQFNLQEAIKKQAILMGNAVDSKTMESSTAMVAALKIYSDWELLPTEYERNKLKDTILLSMHRPWFQEYLLQHLRGSKSSQERQVFSLPLMGGKKILMIKSMDYSDEDRRLSVSLWDIDTNEDKFISNLDLTTIGVVGKVSKDGMEFFWVTRFGLYVGKLTDFEVKLERIDLSDSFLDILNARFIENETKIAVLTHEELIVLNVQDIHAEPVRKPINIGDRTLYRDTGLTEDGLKYYSYYVPSSDLFSRSLFDETDAGQLLGFEKDQVPGFDIKKDWILPLQYNEDFLVRVVNSQGEFCNYSVFNRSAPPAERIQSFAQGAPCYTYNWSMIGNVFLVNDDRRLLKRLWSDGAHSFRQNILEPKLAADKIYATQDRVIAAQGEWMFAGTNEYYEGTDDDDGFIRIWKRNGKGNYEQYDSFRSCETMPTRFEFIAKTKALINVCEDAVSVWTLNDNLEHTERTITPDARVYSLALLNEQTLAVGTIDGYVQLINLSESDREEIQKIKVNNGRVWRMTYEATEDRLLVIDNEDEFQIKYFSGKNLAERTGSLTGFRTGVDKLAISNNKKYLVAKPMGKDEMQMKIWDYQDLQKEPSKLSGHKDIVRDISFMGNSGILVSGSNDGIVKLWDVGNPDVPGVSLRAVQNANVDNVAGVPDKNEFIVQTSDSQMYQYKLDSMEDILKRTCAFLKPYLASSSDVKPEQRQLCQSLNP